MDLNGSNSSNGEKWFKLSLIVKLLYYGTHSEFIGSGPLVLSFMSDRLKIILKLGSWSSGPYLKCITIKVYLPWSSGPVINE